MSPNPPASANNPPTSTQMEDSVESGKQVEFYASTVNAWYATTLEHDKSLFTLAGGGIGILISLLTTVGLDRYWMVSLFAAAIISFLICLWFLLRIFNGNRDYLEKIVDGSARDADKNLKRWDKTAKLAFFTGVVLAAVMATLVAVFKIESKREEEMAKQTETRSSPVMTGDSMQGAAKLQPLGKSFQGAANLAPNGGAVPSASAPASNPASAPAAAPSQATPSSGGSASVKP